MLEFAEKLYQELLSKLERLGKGQPLQTFLQSQRLSLVLTAIDRLNSQLRTYRFSNPAEEIHFFKNLLPPLLSLPVYYADKFEIETIGQMTKSKFRQACLDQQLRRLREFNRNHAEFISYYYSEKADLDQRYYLRNGEKEESSDLLITMMDPAVCTGGSLRAAMILAYSRLESEICCLLVRKKQAPSPPAQLPKLIWTDSKTGLIEVIYAFQAKGSFNHGKADVKTITSCFESWLAVELGNTSHQFQQIMGRKKSTTDYLDQMKDKLIERTDEIEEEDRRKMN